MAIQCREMSLVGNPGAQFLSLVVIHFYRTAAIQYCGALPLFVTFMYIPKLPEYTSFRASRVIQFKAHQ